MKKDNDRISYINLDNYNVIKDNNDGSYWLSYNNENYFFKEETNLNCVYKEMIAQELAKDFGIPYVNYGFARFNNNIGIVSKSFIDNNSKYIPMNKILFDCYKEEVLNHNNLEDIWKALQYRYNNSDIVASLMNEITDLFMFDCLIANGDRHDENYGIIEGNSIHITPVFDNENMLSKDSLYDKYYSIGVDTENNIIDENILDSFLWMSDSRYKEKLRDKLWIIDRDNLNDVLNRVDSKLQTKMGLATRRIIEDALSYNYRSLNASLNKIDDKKTR